MGIAHGKAMVPLLVIKINVMMAISSSGTLTPNIVNEKTSLGYGQGSVVVVRTFI